MTCIGPNMNLTLSIAGEQYIYPPQIHKYRLLVCTQNFRSTSSDSDLGTVNPSYLTNAQDFSLLANATMLVRQIASTPAAKSLYSAELLPGPTVQTDNDFLTFVENNYAPVFHPIGTAAMLPESLGGVVDSNLRVYGVQGVRVVGKLFYIRVTTVLALRCIIYCVFLQTLLSSHSNFRLIFLLRCME